MSQEYSRPSRESDPHALPDIEVFHAPACFTTGPDDGHHQPGFYWWACSPGCLPDSDPIGPFDTYEEALADAREGLDDGEDTDDNAAGDHKVGQ